MARTRDTGYISAYPVVVAYAEVYGTATGGTSSSITVSGISYTLLSFTSDSNLVVSQSGLFDIFLLGGGGFDILKELDKCRERIKALAATIIY